MRYLWLLMILIFFATTSFCQPKQLDLQTVFSKNLVYREEQKRQENELHLSHLLKNSNNDHFRLWSETHGQAVIDAWTGDYKAFRGCLKVYLMAHPKGETSEERSLNPQIIAKTFYIGQDSARVLFHLLQSMKAIQTHDSIQGWKSFIDGPCERIEISTSTEYTDRVWCSTYGQDTSINDVIALQHLLDSIFVITMVNERWNWFYNNIPKGTYSWGSMGISSGSISKRKLRKVKKIWN